MPVPVTEKQTFRRLVRSRFEETTQACIRKGHDLSLGQPSLNLIVAGELFRSGAAFAIRLGADEDGVANLARGCYGEAQALVRARLTGVLLASTEGPKTKP